MVLHRRTAWRFDGHHNVAAIAIVTAWSFVAGLLVSLGTTAADVGVISTVMLVVYAAQPLTPARLWNPRCWRSRRVAANGISVALCGVALRAGAARLGELFLAHARATRTPMMAAKSPPATAESLQAQNALAGLSRDESFEAVRYRSLLTQAERIRLSLTVLARLRMRLEGRAATMPRSRSLTAISITPRRFWKTSANPWCPGKNYRTKRTGWCSASRLLISCGRQRRRSRDVPGCRGTECAPSNGRPERQLRAAIDLASRATPEGQAQFAKEEARQPWWLRFSSQLRHYART